MKIAAYEAAKAAGNFDAAAEPDNIELNAINAICRSQREGGESVDPAGAKRLVRALVAVGLLRFDD